MRLEFTLSNPLTTEERLQIPRLLGHDANNELSRIQQDVIWAECEEDYSSLGTQIPPLVQHIGAIHETISLLTGATDINLDEFTFSKRYDSCSLQQEFEMLQLLLRKRNLTCVENVREVSLFLSPSAWLHNSFILFYATHV